MYVATRQLKLGPEDIRQPGDPVPEAATWPNLATYLRMGWVKDVPESSSPASAAKATPTSPPTADAGSATTDTKPKRAPAKG